MNAWWQSAEQAFEGGAECVLVTVVGVRGSAPRAAGAPMIVWADGFTGSIGGGALEFEATAQARGLLGKTDAAPSTEAMTENWILGPDIGQCCGGAVDVHFERMKAGDFARLRRNEEIRRDALPQVYVFGAGHVGQAVARAAATLPLRLTCIDERAGMLALAAPHARTIVAEDPLAELAKAPPGALVFIMSHSHALDFKLVRAALLRDDLAFIGLIGSATKQARFRQRLLKDGMSERRLSRLVSPIGVAGISGKEPAVIGVSVAAQILQTIEKIAAAANISDVADRENIRLVSNDTLAT
jgi:xanthine dehydrogenase accessory factor